MKKRNLLSIVVAATMTIALMGCGGTESATAEPSESLSTESIATENTETAETETVGIANPWHDCTEEEANAACACLFKIPDGATNVKWSMTEDSDPDNLPGSLVQAEFEMDNLKFTARAQTTGDTDEDISGLYYDWTVSDDITFSTWRDGYMTGKSYRYISDEKTIDLIRWYDVEIGISYSLSTEAQDLDGFDLQAIADQMYDETKY